MGRTHLEDSQTDSVVVVDDDRRRSDGGTRKSPPMAGRSIAVTTIRDWQIRRVTLKAESTKRNLRNLILEGH